MYNNGTIYRGNFLDNMRHGIGEAIGSNNGEWYSGQWYKGSREGYGRAVYQSKDKYEGNWKNDMRSGFGKFTESGQRTVARGHG